MFTLACAYLVAAGNVFFRDLGNVEGHVLRLWWFLSPGLYSLAVARRAGIFKEHPALRTIVGWNPFAILFEAYRKVIYGTPQTPGSRRADRACPTSPRWPRCSSRASSSSASTTVVFKRLEPNFAKVI